MVCRSRYDALLLRRLDALAKTGNKHTAMKDPYRILGVPRSASEAEIKKAYRTLAKKYHPDHNANDAALAERFKDISAAYSLIGDSKARQRYDRGEMDAAGAQRAYAHQTQGRTSGFEGFARGAGRFQAEDLFSEFFGNFRRQEPRASAQAGASAASPSQAGEDQSYEIEVGFVEALKGATARITLDWGKTLEVKIPAGVRDGQQIRLKGQGARKSPISKAGDALLTVKVKPHDYFTRKDNDIHVDLPISLREAVLGAKVRAPTIDGSVTLTIPPNSSGGTMLRLREKGVRAASGGKAGDQYVRLQIVLPERPDPALEKLVKSWSSHHDEEIRKHFR